MKVNSRRDNFFRVLVFGSIFICIAPLFFVYKRDGLTNEFIFGSLIIMAIAGLLLWIWHHTYYRVENNHLIYHSGPFKGKIDIEDIKKITVNKTSYVGLKFGLARNGIIIESTTHMDLYISPQNAGAFLKKIVEINPAITLSK
ncbi:MAG: PH domain-containing protein [Putridiphycobacter sp.]|nr:PH domain-containing protein [Putridiphycobacter sp.]